MRVSVCEFGTQKGHTHTHRPAGRPASQSAAAGPPQCLLSWADVICESATSAPLGRTRHSSRVAILELDWPSWQASSRPPPLGAPLCQTAECAVASRATRPPGMVPNGNVRRARQSAERASLAVERAHIRRLPAIVPRRARPAPERPAVDSTPVRPVALAPVGRMRRRGPRGRARASEESALFAVRPRELQACALPVPFCVLIAIARYWLRPTPRQTGARGCSRLDDRRADRRTRAPMCSRGPELGARSLPRVGTDGATVPIVNCLRRLEQRGSSRAFVCAPSTLGPD